jgi:hypothetical protein
MLRQTDATLFLVLALVCCCSCGGGSPGDPTPPATEWSLGPETTQDLDLAPGETVDEPVSGGVIVFPEGAAGTLVLAEILNGPDAPYEGAGVSIAYDSVEPLLLRLPDPGDETVVLGWGLSAGSFAGEVAGAERWLALAGAPAAGTTEFALNPPFESTDKRTNRFGYTRYWIASIPPDAVDATRLTAVRAQAAADIQSWLDALPAALRPAVEARTQAMRPTYYPEDEYYIGFTRYRWGTYPSPMLGLRPHASADNTSHEVGHYMHHMLIGNALYLQAENQAPDDHGIGDFHAGRPSIGEDIAYFSQFLLRGLVNQYDPTEPAELLGRQNPRVVDFPGVEGLACCLLARLWSADATIGALSDVSLRRPVPVVGCAMADVLGVIALGALTPDELLADVTTYLAGRGQLDVLPVLLERLGWTYMIRVRLVDQDGAPLRNVQVEKLAVSNLTAYHPWTRYATTDDDGYLQDDYCFPLDSILRVEHLGETHDVPIHIDTARPTDVRVDLGALTVGNALDLRLARYAQVELRVYGSFDDTGGLHDDWITLGPGGYLAGTLSDDVFTATADYNSYGYHFVQTLHVTVDPASGAVTAYDYVGDANSTASGDYEHVEFSGGGVPLVQYDHGTDSVFYQASVSGAGVCDGVYAVERATVYGGTPGSMTGYACEGTGGSAMIRIRLTTNQSRGDPLRRE